jgi:hypothetical protein
MIQTELTKIEKLYKRSSAAESHDNHGSQGTQLQQRLKKKEYVILNSLWNLKLDLHGYVSTNESVLFFEDAKKALESILEYRKEVKNVRHIVQSSKNIAKLYLHHEKYGVVRNEMYYHMGIDYINKAIQLQIDDKGGREDEYAQKLKTYRDALIGALTVHEKVATEMKEQEDEPQQKKQRRE